MEGHDWALFVEPPLEAWKCIVCHEKFPESEVITFDNKQVCVGSKPVFVQGLKEGVNIATPVNGVWRNGNLLFVEQEADLPQEICIKCGAPAEGNVKKKYYWHQEAS